MSDNLKIYEAVKAVPANAIKPITGGRLKGMSDLNPMWRIKTLTEQFGPCGFGWRYEITSKGVHAGGKDEVAAFVDINLYVKVGDVWSEAIPGTGGSSFVAQEKNGLYTNDECFKMALTDAISVACKALGVGADVYWDKDRTKYNDKPQQPTAQPKASKEQLETIFALAKEMEISAADMKEIIYARTEKKSSKELSPADADSVIEYLEKQKEATA